MHRARRMDMRRDTSIRHSVSMPDDASRQFAVHRKNHDAVSSDVASRNCGPFPYLLPCREGL